MVTGAASGIGLATATAFAEQGMRVMLADLEVDALAAAERSLAAAGHDVASVATDVSVWGQVERLAAKTVEHFGSVHVVHNNAGVMLTGPIEAYSLLDWEWLLGVNLFGVIHGVKAFLPLIKQAGEGHIVNTASTAGLHALAMTGAYNVTKFGVVALSETLQRELDSEGSPVGASVLCPGAINTRIVDSDRHRPKGESAVPRAVEQGERFKDFARKMLAEEGMPPADVAAMVVEAIREPRFWIITHPEYLDYVSRRAEAMAKDGGLVPGP